MSQEISEYPNLTKQVLLTGDSTNLNRAMQSAVQYKADHPEEVVLFRSKVLPGAVINVMQNDTAETLGRKWDGVAQRGGASGVSF